MRASSLLAFGSLMALGLCRPATRQNAAKPVFAHYMIGEIHDEHTRQDIVDAQALGIDAFALNINQLADWATNTVDRLFKNADELGFGLFFSFDMAPGYFTDPAQYADYLKPFLTRPSYFRYANKALVSTFGGEGVSNGQWSSFKSSVGDVLVVPGFYQAQPSDSFFADKVALDGVFNWNSWPFPDAGKAPASTEQDKTYQSAAKSASKFFMLGISPIQFKHIDAGQSWYRRGEDNLEERFAQALKLQPDMLELQTWNDAGESHYMGNIWDEPMTGSPIHNYVDGYDHKGYWHLLGPFVQAWKRGDATTAGMVPSGGNAVQGAFWHHTLTVDADCSADPIGKAKEIAQNAEDVVSGVVLVAKGKTGLVAVVNNGEKELGKTTLVEGFNKFKFEGLGTGKVQLEIWDGSNLVVGGYAPMEVSDKTDNCNYNFQVVGFSV